jgi:outer membrane protein OmpA-like peptidoglycan-associated protein
VKPGLSRVAFVLLILTTAQALAQGAAPASPMPLASVESRWGDVYCDLTELARTGASELSVRYRYRNTRGAALSLPNANLVARTRVFDPESRTLFGVLKDASGVPISSTMMSGQSARPVPANGTQAHWVRLEAPPESVTSLSVFVEGCLPFDDVAIGAASSTQPLSTRQAAIASQEAEAEGLVAEITGVNRTAGGFLTVTFRYRNDGASTFAFPWQRHVAGSYYLDDENRRKYEVVRSQQQEPLCSDNAELVGQAGEKLAAGSSIAFWAKFAAPPEATQTVSVWLPFAPPFDDVPISGAASGSAGGGAAVAGSVVGLEAALKDLGAEVTETEIRIDLSADVLFDFDKADVKQEAEKSLEKVVTVLKAHPGASVAIEGHTDGKGEDAYNQTLSEQRAASVKQWLVSNAQLDGSNITTKGWGESKPIAHNTKPDGSDDPEGRAKNRRVEIVVRKG